MKAETPSAVSSPPELHLTLLDQETVDDRPRLPIAGAGSIIIHALIVLALIGIAQLPEPKRLSQEAFDNFQRAISIVAPPQELTQKAPNKSKVAKDLSVENLTAKPEMRPSPKLFRPPAPPPGQRQAAVPQPTPNIEPPQIAQAPPPSLGNSALAPPVAAPPPQIKPPEEKPKLAFETPGVSSGTPSSTTGTGRIPMPPRSGIQDAMRQSRTGPGAVSVGDNTDEPGIYSQMNPQSGPGKPASSLELLSDPMGVDFKPYLIRILTAVRRNWFAVIPESARLGRRGRTVLQFAISKDGRVPKLVIVTPSGAEALDRAAVAGISMSNPFPPLPSEFKGDTIRVQFVFSYNVPR